MARVVTYGVGGFDGTEQSIATTAVLAPVRDLPPPAVGGSSANTDAVVSVATFDPSTDPASPSLIRPLDERGRLIVVQNIGSNEAKFVLNTADDFEWFGFPTSEAAYSIVVPAGSEYVENFQWRAMYGIAPLGTTLRVITTIGADA